MIADTQPERPFELAVKRLDSAYRGTSLAEIQKATGLARPLRARVLSAATNKHNLKIESTKTGAGDRVYQIKK